MPSIIRYPGSKAKLTPMIRQFMPDWMVGSVWNPPLNAWFVEPFFGSGAAGLQLLEHVNSSIGVWINDIDYPMYALWHAVLHETRRLVMYVREFEPTKEEFYRLKDCDGQRSGCIARDAFQKIALHRMSVSGFGAKSGGPIGGKKQGGAYTVGCRWTPASIEQAIYNAKETLMRFSQVRITNLHFRDVLKDVTDSSVVYLDPPYYVKGAQLYSHNMSPEEHAELASLLHDTRADWRLSYDDCPEIRDLYSWASFQELEIRYTNAVTDKKRPKNRELLFSPPPQEIDGDYVGMGWVGKDGQP
jgi:DNA adenine methylase